MSNVTELNKVDRPHIVALISAIENAINEIAPGKMTQVEVVGVLEFVKQQYLPMPEIEY